MMGAKINHTGVRYGLLVGVKDVGPNNHGKRLWLFHCDCGSQKRICAADVKNGRVVSCGCFNKHNARVRATVHGGCGTAEYRSWGLMKDRCGNPKNKHYADYGGRGITVCKRWREDYAAFLSHIGRKPSPDHSIDRIDNDGNYEPDNVRWATPMEQSGNKRNNRWITYNGRTQILADWAREIGINESSLRERLEKWTLKRALIK